MRAVGNLRLSAPTAGVVNTTSPIRRNRISRIFNEAPGTKGTLGTLGTLGTYFSIVASSISITGMSSLIGYTR